MLGRGHSSENMHRFFLAATRVRDALVSLIISHTEVLLYAQSGAGKSSLVNAA
jgi:predicted GTPase